MIFEKFFLRILLFLFEDIFASKNLSFQDFLHQKILSFQVEEKS